MLYFSLNCKICLQVDPDRISNYSDHFECYFSHSLLLSDCFALAKISLYDYIYPTYKTDELVAKINVKKSVMFLIIRAFVVDGEEAVSQMRQQKLIVYTGIHLNATNCNILFGSTLMHFGPF